MKGLFINLSPHRDGTSALLLTLLNEQLEQSAELWHLTDLIREWERFIQAAQHADTWIFATPCYVNAIPGDALSVLEKLQEESITDTKHVYALAQGGMPYAHTHHCCISNIELLSEAMQLQWMGGFILGGGAMIHGESLNLLPNVRQVKRSVYKVASCVQHQSYLVDELTQQAQLHMPVWLTWLLSRKMNAAIHKQQKQLGLYRQVCPYVREEAYENKG